MTECPSEQLLIEYQLGSCDDDDASAIEAHLAECDRCRTRCEQTAAGDDDILRRVRQVLDADGHRIAVAAASTGPGQPISVDESDLAASVLAGVEGYQIIRELGRGGMGAVYLASQKSTKRLVALKVLLEGPFASPVSKRRFEREVELAAQLQHPHIVTVLESGIANGRYYFAMQYVEGQRLDTFAAERKLAPNATLRVFLKVCQAVNYAHQRGVIHRDLKPSNILVDGEGNPHILDFGLAKPAGGNGDVHDTIKTLSITGQVMGTLPYMSPEQAGGAGHNVDVRTDVYSLGVILYEMLTGQFPYQVVGQIAEVLRNIAEVDPKRPSTIRRRINNEIETIVLTALAKDKERRYQTAASFASDIERYLTGQPIEAKRDSGWYVLTKTLRRYRVPTAITLAFVLIVAVSISSALRQRTRLTRAAATELLAAFVDEPAEAMARTRAAGRHVVGLMTASSARCLSSPAYTERVMGARSGLLLCPDEFWESVDGGALWLNGEWLELCLMPGGEQEEIMTQIEQMAVAGADRQKYVAFCLLGQIGNGSDSRRRLCADAARTERHPGVAAAALWAANRLGEPVVFADGDPFLVDALAQTVFVKIEGTNSFRPGSDSDDPDRFDDEDRPADGVTIDSFYLAHTEVSWPALQRFLDHTQSQVHFGPGETEVMQMLLDGLPEAQRIHAAAGHVCLTCARAYCDWLNDQAASRSLPRRYRLPTELEWEYACRGGNARRFCYGDRSDYARFFAHCNGDMPQWHVSRQRMPNWYGMFDMHGGVWEWCDTSYEQDSDENAEAADDDLWILRGGAYYSPAVRCRSAQRNYASVSAKSQYFGFRLAMDLVSP